MTRRLCLVDLFAGCGGLTRGFLDVNLDPDVPVEYHVIAAVEADRTAAATYAANFGRDHVYPIKIEDWHSDEIPSADVVIGGPPCQGFSNLGRRDPNDPRNVLWREYARTLERIRPGYFVIENVAAFFRSPQWDLLQAEVENGKLGEYRLQPYVLNAAEFGVPQVRKRAVVIGRHRDMPPVPDPVGELAGRPDLWVTVSEALADLPAFVPPDAIELPGDRFEFDGTEIPGAFKTSQLHLTRTMTDISRRRIAAVPRGGNRFDIPSNLLPNCWRNHKTGSMDVMGRLHADRPSVTIRTEFHKPEKGRYLHPTENRPITHAEAALLQTFPLDFQWCGSKVSIARQIGNAVPVRLARALGSAIGRMYA
ncbi:DNA (cytosine-5)-methyltransferase 1 [Pseudonocardia thermophila]|uniref:Cytosine-specific methyltransferase n=1 Tax=Pseudonocardia thermophila TaxID=1848 RepID=A0A1M6S9D7_PSETH|nr:DNA cytosine methyltransferase [Pseudonocardia thermophila]SHK41291.1 DNA (cytosine-5)-methyltransferase 1 [Pseudonocardia thermophila]